MQLKRPMGRSLLLAAGGGFDILTVQSVLDLLLKLGVATENDVDVAGWLNPKFDHFLSDGTDTVVFEKPVNYLGLDQNIVRFRRLSVQYDSIEHPEYVWYERYGTRKPIVDNEVPGIVGRGIYCLSTRYGLVDLTWFCSAYDKVIVCDVGGDILFSGPEDSNVKTPLLDALSLATLRRVRLEAKSLSIRVAIVGLGSDHELEPRQLARNLDRIARNQGLLGGMRIDEQIFDRLECRYAQVVNKYGGNTILRMLRARQEFSRAQDNATGIPLFDPTIAYLLDFDAVCALNPLSTASSLKEMYEMATSMGWREESSQ